MRRELLIVCSEAAPQVGGIASLLSVFCQEVSRRSDYRTHLLCRPGTDPGLAERVHARLSWPRHALLNLPYQLANARVFAELVERHAYEQVVFFDAAARLYGVGLAPERRSSVLVHGTELLATSSEWKSRRLWLQRRAMQRAQRVVATSKAVAALAAAALPGLVAEVVHPCFDRDRVYASDVHRRSPYPVAAGTFVLLTVSRLSERKGHEDVLRLLARVRHRLPLFHYFVVGEGPQRSTLEALIGALGLTNEVTLLGAVPTAELGRYYHFADLFIMLSRSSSEGVEGFGLTFIEAMLSGTPSLASRHGGVVEAVQHDVTGLTVDPADAAATDEALLALVHDEQRRRRYAEAGRVWAEQELTPAAFTRKLLG